MTNPEGYEKTTEEKHSVDINFEDEVPPGATSISSATLSAVGYPNNNPEDKDDATNEVLQTTTGTIVNSGKSVRALIKAGQAGYTYEIKCLATWNDSLPSVLSEKVTVKVNA